MPSPIKQTVAGAFAEFEEALKLDKPQVDAARRRHNEVRDCLTTTDLVATSFLQGSFARKTMISPLQTSTWCSCCLTATRTGSAVPVVLRRAWSSSSRT